MKSLEMTSNEEYIRKNKVVIVDDDKNTKLHYAAAVDNAEEIKKIIDSGHKLDPENYLGWTPLMMAVRNANVAAVNLLLFAGANTTKRNTFGLNVFLISVTCGDLALVEKILEHLLCGGVSRQFLQKEFSPISMTIMFQQTHIFKYLLQRKFDPNAATALTGITPLMFAAALENHKAINKLLKSNADPARKNYLGKAASDILQLRHKKIDIENNSLNRKQPVIIVTPHNCNSQQLQLTPYLKPVIQEQQPIRKSSNTLTPNTPFDSSISPLTPQILPQTFFGPEFSPNQFMYPVFPSPFNGSQIFNVTYTVSPGVNNASHILNTTINPVFPSSMFTEGRSYAHSA